MKRALPFFLVLVVLAGCTAVPVDPGAQPTSPAPSEAGVDATVVDVVDGDTVEVRYPDGTTDTVRLLGIDTPEVHTANTPGEFEGVPDTDAGRACLRTAGHEASEYANATLFQEEVRLVTDPLADRRGDYGRLLA